MPDALGMDIRYLVLSNLIAICVFIGREIYSWFKDSTKENTKALQEVNESLGALRQAVTKLDTQMHYVHRDLAALAERNRQLEEQSRQR